MKILALFTALVVCLSSTQALSAENKNASFAADNLVYFDENAFSWPGDAEQTKPLVVGVKANPGLAIAPITPFGECAFVDNLGDESVYLSFETKEIWEKNKSSLPENIKLSPCCKSMEFQTACSPDKRIIHSNRNGFVEAFVTGHYVTHHKYVIQCQAPSLDKGVWVPLVNGGDCPQK